MGIKKVCDAIAFRLLVFSSMTFYSATFTESQHAFTESQQAFTESEQALVESQQAFTESQQALTESQAVFALLLVLLPQEANEIAVNATNKNTNFFIFFVFSLLYNCAFF